MKNIISPLSGSVTEEAKEGTETRGRPAPHAEPQPLPAGEKKLGVALVGLGKYSESQLAPALTETRYCRLSAVVSGSDEKRQRWAERYKLKPGNLYDYSAFDDIGGNDDIDIVYVVLPNALHAEYVVRAARAGKHVICEKPMATTVEDCRRMIDACRAAGVKLSIGYRLQFDPFHKEMMRMAQHQTFGSLQRVVAQNGLAIGDPKQWRLDAGLAGGGPLMDVGIYCVQAALYCTGELPHAVSAHFHPRSEEAKFRGVEEGISWELEFPAGVRAECTCTYKGDDDLLRVEAVDGWFQLTPAFAYEGLQGETSAGALHITPRNHQAAQLDDFALCVSNGAQSRVPGEMGMRDVEILLSIYRAARRGERVPLALESLAL